VEPRSALRPTGRRALVVEGRWKVDEGRRGKRIRAQPEPPESFGMFVLRLWMWAVPIILFIASVTFGGIAVADGKWGLFVMMLFMGCIAVSLFVFHWWVLYRFGSKAR